MAKILNVLLALLLILLLAFLAVQFYELSPQEKQDLRIFITSSELPETNASSELVMFMPNMRFDTNRLSYYFSDCEQEKQTRVLEALSIISNETQNIFFYEINSEENAKIKIYCSNAKKPTRNNSFVAGEGGPDSLVNLSLYPLINSGQIYIYGTQKPQCEYPIVEIHELMHVFGFDHIQDKMSILYPYVSCDQKITSEMVLKLRALYSIEPKADLLITNASVSKSGVYLNFELSFYNQGLIEASDIELEIYDNSNNKKLDNYPIQNIEPGLITRTLKIQNLRLPSRNTNDLRFLVKTKTLEFFYENNEVIAKLNG